MMRFTTAWAAESAQNVVLKCAVLGLSLCCIVLGATSTKLALRDPLVIERACYSTSRATADPKRTPEEVNAFLMEALSQRFNSDVAPKEDYMGSDELKFRSQEQADLKRQEMTQRLIITAPVKVEGNVLSVEADRLISVGKIRSAFPFPLTVTLSQTTRTDGNPYGLLIEKVALPATGVSADDGKGK